MNPAIQTALARVAALKAALGAAAGKAGTFVKDEVKGTLANISPAAVEGRYQAIDDAQRARDNAAAINGGMPGGVAQWEDTVGKTPDPLSTNMLGDFAHSIVNAYRSIRKKK